MSGGGPPPIEKSPKIELSAKDIKWLIKQLDGEIITAKPKVECDLCITNGPRKNVEVSAMYIVTPDWLVEAILSFTFVSPLRFTVNE